MSFHKVTPVKKNRKPAAPKKQAGKPAPKTGAKKPQRRPVGKK
ncbi:hypothetical protein AB0H18_30130 [Streptomyces sp. NPDC020766]